MSFISRYITLLVSLGLLTACAVGPDYHRPKELTPAQFRKPAAMTQPTPGKPGPLLADLPWWQVFADPQLQRLIRTALAYNQDLKIATARVAEARASLGIVTADLYPQLDAAASASRTQTPKPLLAYEIPPSPTAPQGVLYPARVNNYSAMLDLSYEVDLWGRVRRAKQASAAQLKASEQMRQTVISSLVSNVAQSYFTLVELDRELEITSATLRLRRQTLALMELRREHGKASALEVSRFRADVSSTLAALAVLRQQDFQTENAISILLGQAPQEIHRGLKFKEQPPIPTVPTGLPADLLERRPDLKSAEQQLVAATANIGVAKAEFFPRIALTADYGFQSLAMNQLLAANSQGWMIAGNATQPIFEGGRHWYNYQGSKAQQEEALQNYRKVILQALREVSDALVARQQSAEAHRQLTSQVQALRDSVYYSNLRYRAGKSSYLELLDAEQQLFTAEILMEQAQLGELLSAVYLYKALGGGVEQSKVKCPKSKVGN